MAELVAAWASELVKSQFRDEQLDMYALGVDISEEEAGLLALMLCLTIGHAT